MSREAVDAILDQVRNLPPPDRVLLADEIDRLTWRDRMYSLVDRIQERKAGMDVPDDEEIDRIVDEVRSEKPLYERYWTRRRQSAP